MLRAERNIHGTTHSCTLGLLGQTQCRITKADRDCNSALDSPPPQKERKKTKLKN